MKPALRGPDAPAAPRPAALPRRCGGSAGGVLTRRAGSPDWVDGPDGLHAAGGGRGAGAPTAYAGDGTWGMRWRQGLGERLGQNSARLDLSLEKG